MFSPGDRIFRPVDDPLRHDFLNYLPDDLLRKTDTASMAVALEVRAPFLARDLVDAALRTPLDVLMPPTTGPSARASSSRSPATTSQTTSSTAPSRASPSPSASGSAPTSAPSASCLHDHLLAADPFPGLADAGVEINTGFVRRMLREHDAAGERSLNPWHGRDHSQRLYMLLVLSIWSRWLDRSLTDAPAA
jgi:asparagine synthase (glutamine-hydrolysing)